MSRSKTKLVSVMMGVVLIVERNGQEEKKEYTLRLPTHIYNQPIEGIQELCDFLNGEFEDEFGVQYTAYDAASEPVNIPVAKPKRIKAPRKVTHEQFNKRIAELGS